MMVTKKRTPKYKKKRMSVAQKRNISKALMNYNDKKVSETK